MQEEKLKEIDEKYPGSVKPANELPPVQDPFKDFEDRNPRETAAYGGRMGFQEAGFVVSDNTAQTKLNFTKKQDILTKEMI